MAEWDPNDRADWHDARGEARAELYEEARQNAQEDEFQKRALHCGDCGFSWTPGWIPHDKLGEKKYSAAHAAGTCPRCGSKRRR